MNGYDISVVVNGQTYEKRVEPRRLLADFIRHDLQLRGTRVGCEHGVCGSCTVLLDGEPTRSCITLAVQTDGYEVQTVESLTEPTGAGMHPLQEAFSDCHALQCGFCTSGFLMTLKPVYDNGTPLNRDEAREAISGNLCRCTGYQQIVEATERALQRRDEDS